MKKLFIATATAIALFSSATAFADYQKTYTQIDGCYGSGDNGCAIIKGASRIEFRVEYSQKLGTSNGETVTILFDNNDNWKKITRDYNGLTASVVSVRRW